MFCTTCRLIQLPTIIQVQPILGSNDAARVNKKQDTKILLGQNDKLN